MKKYILTLVFFLSILGVSANNPQLLKNKMRTFFLETLENNYSGTDDTARIRQFLNDYLTKSYEDPANFKLEIDVKSLKKINKELFKQDYFHYYYFYRGLVFSEAEFNKATKKGLPVGFSQNSSLQDRNHYRDIDLGDLYIMELKRYNPELFNSSIINNFFVSFRIVAEFYLTELNNRNKEVMDDFITVVFWKYLCEQSSIDFYSKK